MTANLPADPAEWPHADLVLEVRRLRGEREWQPMATAPKDGRQILARMYWKPDWRPEPCEVTDIISWTEHNGGGWVSHAVGKPICWAPIIEPPGPTPRTP